MSVNQGETVQFKVLTPATAYHADIYRMGYYSGLGARLITTIQPSATLPQTQPDCLSDSATGLIDCGNWAVSASWAVPATAVSGVYIAKLVRDDVPDQASQIIFVVRNDTGHSDLLVQTSDATWQAYNNYGGNSLYTGAPVGRAFKVSYNRPFLTRNSSPMSWFFDSEYPFVRWAEANAYDVSYTSSVDTVTRGPEILEHKMFVSSGHDEYWSNEMRSNVQTARDNAVNVTFFSGNEIFWKTRWEDSITQPTVAFRTMVCYKETLANNSRLDPTSTWTGTWRDPRYSPPADGGRPENALTGTLFMVNGVANDSIQVPAEFGDMRLWRNTAIATLPPGQSVTFPAGTLGYEWDEAPDNDVTPPGLVKFSRTVVSTPDKFLLDYGSLYGAGVATHSLVLYRQSGGGLVFGAGTTQWAWGLDAVHDRAGSPTDINMQQATVNLFADMGTQPASLQSGLVPATQSTDTTPPTSTITNPSSTAAVVAGRTVTIQGTATDTGGGVVGGVEISFDGTRWVHATGRNAWQYQWTPTGDGPVTIRVRAVDDIGNLQTNPTTANVTIGGTCCTLWSSTTVPDEESHSDPNAVELGVKFQPTTSGLISGVRFYKGAANTGPHIGHLWTSTGTLLAEATFTNETASGWQQVSFSTPVEVSANTTYVASYHTSGNYAVSRPYFTSAFSNFPLIALASAASGGNGVYTYSSTSTFPTQSFQSTNYWVDVVFSSANSLWDNTVVPAIPSFGDTQPVTLGVKFTASASGVISGIRFYKGAANTGTHVGSLWDANGALLASATFTNESASGWQDVSFSTPVGVSANTTYVASYFTSSGNYSLTRPYFANAYINGPLTAPASSASGGNGVYSYGATNTFPASSFKTSNYWVDLVYMPTFSLWDSTAVPAVQSFADTQSVTLGMKFTTTTSGFISGIRFFKGSLNTGTHVGSLWSASGTLLASATFTNESASGWQQVNFSTPVAVTANTTYVASYFTSSGYYSTSRSYFLNAFSNGPLTGLASATSGGNGVYAYGASNAFPTGSYQSTNYWVDVAFAESN